MKLLQSRAGFGVALLLVACAAAIYTWFSFRIFKAHLLSERRDQASLFRATQLEPKDAVNYDLLGQLFMWDVQDPRAAERQFRQAVSLNSYDSGYWLHLAQAYNSTGEEVQQANAIRRAIADNPTTPEIAWMAANFFLLQGDTTRALDSLAVVVRNDPQLAEAALTLSWRTLGDARAVESRLPPDPEIYLKFMKVLLAREQWDAASHVWSALWELNRDFDPHSAMFYIDALLTKRDVSGAQNAWQDLLRNSRILKPYVSPGNLVVNGNFDHEILNAGFDWHYAPVPNVAVMLDSTQSHEASQSLLITYSGPSQDFGMFQYVPVTPGVTYIASAWVKSEELQTANGPRLSVVDPYTNIEYVHSEETLGTSSWHRVTGEFTVLPDTRLVLLRFSRQPWETLIQGRFWVDGIRLAQNGVMNSQ